MTQPNKDVKAPPTDSSLEGKSDVKAIESIVDSVMQTHSDAKDPSTEVEKPATPTAEKEAPEGSVPKQNETGEMDDEEVKKEKEEEPTPEDAPEGEPEEEAAPETDKKTEEAVPYERFKEVNEKVKSLEPLAQAHQQIVQHCQTNRIDPTQFAEGMNMMALVNNNPEQALQKFEGYVEQLRVALGKGLPADLQQEVTDGTLSEKRAKEIAQSRIQMQSRDSTNRFSQLQQQQAEQQQTLQAMGSWMDNKLKLNPSFKQKAKPTDQDGLFEDFLKNNTWLFTQRRPMNGQSFTPFELTSMAEEAYGETMKMAQRYTPKPVTKKAPVSSSGASHRSTAPRDAKSPEDVVNQIAAKYKIS